VLGGGGQRGRLNFVKVLFALNMLPVGCGPK